MNTQHTSSSLEINGSPINRVNYTKSLGVLMDQNLTCRNHIEAISRKISSGIGSIKQARHCLWLTNSPCPLQLFFVAVAVAVAVVIVVGGGVGRGRCAFWLCSQSFCFYGSY